MSRVRAGIVFCLLFSIVLCTAAFGQRTTATIYGSVTDASNAIVPGAIVLVTNELTGGKFPGKANERGEFTITFLPVGRYTIQVHADGFTVFHQTGLDLSAGQQTLFPVKLEVGNVASQVTVTASAPVVENASAALRESINNNQVMELPQSRRDFTRLLSLQNGMRDTGAGRFQFNGLASGGSTITVDGTDASGDAEQVITSFYTSFNFINVISQEAIQEVQVAKGVMSAEIARTFGGNVNVVSKSGTNQYHGSLFENLQNDVINAKYVFQLPGQPKAPVRFNQFGGSLGGPIIKDKLFFYGVYEGYRLSTFQTFVGNVPTREFKEKAIAAVPAYKTFLDLFPLATEPYAPTAVTGLYRGNGSSTGRENHAVVRTDYRINAADLLTARYTRSRPGQVIPRLVEFNARESAGASEVGNLNFIHAAPSWTTETRFGFNMMNFTRMDGLWSRGKIPGITVTGAFGDDGEGLHQGGHIWSLEQVLAKTIGRHTLKTGGIFLRRTPGREDEQIPAFTYSNAADFLANSPARLVITFGNTPFQGRSWEMGYFVQDDFRVRPNLILNLGVRYDYFSVYKEREGRFFNPDGWAGAVVNPPRMRPSDSAYNADRNNFMPRMGFAWTLDKSGQTVVRGGFGVFVGPFSIQNFQTQIFRNLDIPYRSTFTQNDLAALGIKYPISNAEVAIRISGTNFPRGYQTTNVDKPNPYNMQWTLDIQRRLTRTLALQTGYVANRSLKIVAQRAFNQPERLTNIRPFPDALQFTYEEPSEGTYYHSWQTSLRKRFSENLSFSAQHTWGKGLGLSGGDFSWGGAGSYQDDRNFRADKGPISFDLTHRFVADYIYQIPADKWLSVSGPARHVIGGWQLSGIFNAQVGGWITITQSANRQGQRADYIGGNPLSTSGDRFQYLNAAAFALVPVSLVSSQAIRPGNLGRSNIRGPGFWSLDFSLAKNFAITERKKLQIRADAFNAFNHVNLGVPVTIINNPNFGRILSAGTERRMQLNARLSF